MILHIRSIDFDTNVCRFPLPRFRMQSILSFFWPQGFLVGLLRQLRGDYGFCEPISIGYGHNKAVIIFWLSCSKYYNFVQIRTIDFEQLKYRI